MRNMKLYLVTHAGHGHGAGKKVGKVYVAARYLEVVARVYDNAQNVELVSDKVMVLKTPEDLKGEE